MCSWGVNTWPGYYAVFPCLLYKQFMFSDLKSQGLCFLGFFIPWPTRINQKRKQCFYSCECPWTISWPESIKALIPSCLPKKMCQKPHTPCSLQNPSVTTNTSVLTFILHLFFIELLFLWALEVTCKLKNFPLFPYLPPL